MNITVFSQIYPFIRKVVNQSNTRHLSWMKQFQGRLQSEVITAMGASVPQLLSQAIGQLNATTAREDDCYLIITKSEFTPQIADLDNQRANVWVGAKLMADACMNKLLTFILALVFGSGIGFASTVVWNENQLRGLNLNSFTPQEASFTDGGVKLVVKGGRVDGTSWDDNAGAVFSSFNKKGFTFYAESGRFTHIVMICNGGADLTASGWTADYGPYGMEVQWTGLADSVNYVGSANYVTEIVFTIDDTKPEPEPEPEPGPEITVESLQTNTGKAAYYGTGFEVIPGSVEGGSENGFLMFRNRPQSLLRQRGNVVITEAAFIIGDGEQYIDQFVADKGTISFSGDTAKVKDINAHALGFNADGANLYVYKVIAHYSRQVPLTDTVVWNSWALPKMDFLCNASYTWDEVTLTAIGNESWMDGTSWKLYQGSRMGGAFNFSSARGNFKRIEILTNSVDTLRGEGWRKTGRGALWIGDADNVVLDTLRTNVYDVKEIRFTFSSTTFSGGKAVVRTDSELRAAIKNDGSNILLDEDITLSNSTLSIESGKTVTIDLNGHKLDRKLTKRGEGGGQVITVRNGATLNLSNGTLTGGWGGDGGGIANEGGTANLTNVTITGNHADDRGGGISNRGTLTIDGCTITGNTANAYGGGIWNAGDATLNMKGTLAVTDNTTSGENQNVYLKNGAVINLAGSLAGSSIGICMETPGTFTSDYSTYNSGIAPEDLFTADLPLSTAVSLVSNEAQLSIQSNINYIERSWDEENKKVVNTVKTLTTKIGYSDTPGNGKYKEVTTPNGWFILGGYYLIDDDTSNDNEHEYYVVRGDMKINRTMYMIGKNVHLILCDDAKLTLAYGILMYGPRKLYIHSQSYGAMMGKLIVEKGHGELAAGIGSDWYTYETAGDYGMGSQDPRFEKVTVGRDGTAGSLEVHGGDIYAKGHESGAGIGSGHFTQGTAVTIYGGKVEAHGSAKNDSAAGIGGGWKANGGSFTIYDGYVRAYGGSSSAGIGGGYKGKSGPVTIYGGKVEAHGGDDGSGIGGGSDNKYEVSDITVNGGEVYAYGGNDAAGIGGGWRGSGSNVTVNGGKVVAKGSGNGAGIGSGSENIEVGGIHGGKVTITGGEVYAYGGVDAAGIGGGEDADGGTVVITGGYVYAEGNDWGAGIGGGQDGDGGNVTITGGTVIAKAGRNETGCRAIGPGEGSDEYGKLTIGNSMMVSSERMAIAVERSGMCWYRTQVRVEPCTHADATYTVDGTTAKGTHTEHCQYCTTPFEPELHTFEGDICTVCGVELSIGTGIRTMSDERSQMDDAWYTLDGRKLQGKPTRKGMYIHSGKKVAQ